MARSRAAWKSFVAQTYGSKVINANKMLGLWGGALVQDICVDQNLG